MRAPHHARLLDLLHKQAPDRIEEFTAYLDDPVLFAVLAIAAHDAGTLSLPEDLLQRLQADLARLEPADLDDRRHVGRQRSGGRDVEAAGPSA